MQALILSGGLGTRLKSISGDLPKPLVPMAGKPVIEHQMDCLARSGITDVVFIAGYRADLIEARLQANPRPFRTRVFAEHEPLGSAGGVLERIGELEPRFFVVYGDTIFDVDLARMLSFHESRRADATLLVHPNDHPFDSDLVSAGEDGRIDAFLTYPHRPDLVYRNRVNAGIYCLEAAPLRKVAAALPKKVDFAKDVFPALMRGGAQLYAYASREYIKDMGTPERFEKVERALLSGKVAAMAMRNPAPAIFFDRDGTLTESLDYVRALADLRLLPTAAAAVRRANEAGLLAVLTTNQPVVARGECALETLDEVHRKLETELGREHAYLDGIYSCPHHPDRGFPGEVPELKRVCDCRKPAIGMVETADRDLYVDRERSWVIGDTTVDIQFARNAGMKSALVRSGYAARDGKYPILADYEFDEAAEAVRFIADDYPRLSRSVETWLTANPIAAGSWVTIGGPARSGKSSVSAAVQESLRRQGTRCERIPLDGWLLPEVERGQGFRGRFDLAAIEAFVESLRAPGKRDVEIPVYDRQTRGPFPWKAEIPLAPGTVLIFEGVSAALSIALDKAASLQLWAEAPAELRRARFLEHYRARGYGEAEATRLFESRETEEVRELASLRTGARWIWDGHAFRDMRGTHA